MADDLAALGHKLDKLQRVIVGDPKQLKRVGELSQADVEAAVHADIGDLSLSRWFGGNVEIRGWSEVRSGHEVEVGPVPKARGEMTVLSDGRKEHAAGDRRQSGTYVSKKTGEVRFKSRKVKRTTKASAGRGTWERAKSAITASAPSRVAQALHEGIANALEG